MTSSHRVHGAGAALRAAIAAARRELGERGALTEDTWGLLELLGGELERRLDELESERRLAGTP